MIYSADFDGVVCSREGINRGHWFDSCLPVFDAIDAINWIKAQGHEIYILTARPPEEWDRIKKWLKKWDFPDLEVTNVKKEGTKLIIDDRAIRFTSWRDICKYIG